VASAAAVAFALGSSASPVVGAPAVTASAVRIAVRDNLTVAAGAVGAVATMRGSTSRCPGTVGVSR
jgi:hypothetical protein